MLAALMLVAVALVCAIGALPVRLALSGRRMAHSARTVAQSGGRLGQVMLVAQVATTVVLVFGAGLIVQSLNALLNTDRGFSSTRVLSLRLEVPLLYVPAIQLGEARFLTLHLRTSGPPLALAPAAREAVARLGHEQVGLAATLDFLRAE